MVNTSGRGILSDCLSIFQVLVKAVPDQSTCITPYGTKGTDAFSLGRLPGKTPRST